MQYAPDRLIDTLADLLAAQNEKHLSKLLSISPSVIQGIREGNVSVSPTMLMHMAERAGTNVSAMRVILGDRRQKARMAVGLAPALRKHA